MQKFLVFFAVVAALALTEARMFDRCGLVRELRNHRFPEDKMRDWVCLVESESNRDTSKVTTNRDGSKDYGLFQIDDEFWCSTNNNPGKDCHVTCAALLTDDITAAANCALYTIYQRHGFYAWNGWKKHCNGKPLPDIRNC